MRLLIVDGSNIVMRAAFGGDVPPERAVPTATGIIERCTREFEATHLIVALDGPAGTPSWRRDRYPLYKAHRTTDTTPWLAAAFEAWTRQGWLVQDATGYEADDVIATVALRAAGRAGRASADNQVMVLSGDSDVLPLLSEGVEIIRPLNGGKFESVNMTRVAEKYGLVPSRLPQLKALTGEPGDNVPGVDGIGPVRALALLNAYDTLEGVIAAGERLACKFSIKVAQQAAQARLALELVTLRSDVPLLPIQPKECAL